jgi:hypothetical protein
MSLTTYLTLNTKPLNLAKVKSILFMLKALNAHQDIIAYIVDTSITNM